MALYTYRMGFRFRSSKTITTHHIVNVIKNIEEVFGSEYSFRPEAISEGGIEFVTWPKQSSGQYKSIRTIVHDSRGQWPHIEDVDCVRRQWINELPRVIWPGQVIGEVFYKALYGAPCFTREEVKKLVHSFEAVGMVCSGMRSPSDRSLQNKGPLGLAHDFL